MNNKEIAMHIKINLNIIRKAKKMLKENQELLRGLEIQLKEINEFLPRFIADKQQTINLEKLRDEVITCILETEQCTQKLLEVKQGAKT